MKVALVHDFLNQLGGAERVLDVLHEIFPQAPVFTLLYDEEKTKGKYKNWEIYPSFLQNFPSFFRKHQKFLLPLYPIAIEQFDLSDYDLVISSNNSFAKGVITKSNVPHICYCHAPMRYAWDWHAEYLKEQKLGKISSFFTRFLLNYIRFWDKVSAERVDFWIANSKTTAHRIRKYYRKDSVVIYPPVDISKFESVDWQTKKEDYFLIVSRLSPYKKVDLAVEAFNKLGLHLVIIGEGSQRKELEKIAQDNIEFLGYKPDEVVIEYYTNAKALIFPGEEDFGLTPVEAMACGTPVIAFRKGGVMESVIEGRCGEFFDEPTVESLATAVRKFLAKSKKGIYDPSFIRQRAEEFDKRVFVEKINEVVQYVAEKRLKVFNL